MKLRVVAPDGTAGTIDEAELPNALRQGFKQPVEALAPDAVSEVGNMVGTGALGALSGVTAGLSDVALASKPELRQFVNAQYEQNPGSRMVGEMAGMLASPINAIAPAVEGAKAATALGRLAQKVQSGAAIGTLYGAGSTVSESALGDTQLTAEKLLAGAGLGAVLGGLGGGVGGAIEEGAAKLLPKLSTVIRGSQSALDDVADHATLKAFRNTAKELRRFGDDEIERAIGVVRDRGHLKLSPEAMEKSIAADVAKVGPTKGAFLDAADVASKPDFSAALRGLDEHVAAMSPLEREALASPLKKARAALEDIATDPKLGTWRAFDKWKQDLQAAAKFSRGAAEDDLALGLKRRLAGFAREELDRQLVPALGPEGQKFLDTKQLYGALKTAERLAGNGAGRGSSFSLVDIAASIGLGGAHPVGLIGGLGTKILREHGAAVAAQVADRLAKSPALKAIAVSFAQALPSTAPQLGRYGPALMLAAERSPELALAQHIVTAKLDPEYAAQSQLAGLMPEQPDEQAAALSKATDLAATHAALKAQDTSIREALEHVVKGTKPAAVVPAMKTQDMGARRMRQDSTEAFRRRVDEIREFAANPQALVDRAAKNLQTLGAVAPGVSAMMTSTAQRAVTYLAQQAEMPPKPGPLAREWVPTQAQRHAFTLKLDAVQNPFSILHAAARGTLVKSQIDAVRAVYPSLANEIQQQAMEQMASGAQMPYRARLMLGMLTGIDPDGTMSPKAIAANQRSIAADQSKPTEQMEQTDGKDIGDAGRMATAGQKRELAAETG